MTERMIAFCGLACQDCEAYQVTRAGGDLAAREAIAIRWREEYHSPEITADHVLCDGCQTRTGRAGGYCQECPLRACGLARGVATCAHCSDFAGCARLESFYATMPQARIQLEDIRQLL